MAKKGEEEEKTLRQDTLTHNLDPPFFPLFSKKKKKQVPFRRIHLQDKADGHLDVYDTSGPQGIDPRDGLPKLRAGWVGPREARGDATPTQMHYARAGVVTEEMAFVAAREGMAPEFVRSEVCLFSYLFFLFSQRAKVMSAPPCAAALSPAHSPANKNTKHQTKQLARGRAIIPANKRHVELEPMIIGAQCVVCCAVCFVCCVCAVLCCVFVCRVRAPSHSEASRFRPACCSGEGFVCVGGQRMRERSAKHTHTHADVETSN